MALAEARFLSKQHEWKFDSAWQEMLNNAILKVLKYNENHRIHYLLGITYYYYISFYLLMILIYTNSNFDDFL